MANGSGEQRPALPSHVRERFDDDAETVAGFIAAEHAALETARSATIFEANGRVSSHLAVVSGAVVALAFIGEASALDMPFYVFLFVLLPAILFLSIVTFERALQSGLIDGIRARRVNRLRRFYVHFHDGLDEYLDPPSSEDTPAAVMSQVGISQRGWQLFLTAAGSVGVLNSIIVGVLAGLTVEMFVDALWLSTGVGIVTFAISEALHLRRQATKWRQAAP